MRMPGVNEMRLNEETMCLIVQAWLNSAAASSGNNPRVVGVRYESRARKFVVVLQDEGKP